MVINYPAPPFRGSKQVNLYIKMDHVSSCSSFALHLPLYSFVSACVSMDYFSISYIISRYIYIYIYIKIKVY